jgi:Protein of unknown function (DUF4232)
MVDVGPRTIRSTSIGLIAALALAGCEINPPSSPPQQSPPPSASAATASAVSSPEALVSPSSSPVPWIDATPPLDLEPTPVPIPPGTLTCAPEDLKAASDWEGATGSMAGQLTITNVGRLPCVVNGSPRLIRLRSDTTILAPITYRAGQSTGPGDPPGSAAPVLLRPGDQAEAFLVWSNWCGETVLGEASMLVTLPSGGSPIVADGFGIPRCDDPTGESTLGAWAFYPMPPPIPEYEPQAAEVVLSVPASVRAGGDLAFLVTLTNRGAKPASLDPCPSYTEDLYAVYAVGRAPSPPAPQQFLLNCDAIGGALAPGASVTLQMHYTVPRGLSPGRVVLIWDTDPGGPFEATTGAQASLAVVGP